MSYAVGTYIDLRFLNNRSEPDEPKRAGDIQTEFAVGTKILFLKVGSKLEFANSL